MKILLIFFFSHWFLSLFFHTFFLHRYASHGMVVMNKFWERFFYLCTWLTMGSSFLVPRAYAVMHRKHHRCSDTEHDPHSPHFFKNVLGMMLETGRIYGNLVRYPMYLEKTFPDLYGNLPTWELLDRIGNNRWVRSIFGIMYTFVYIHVILQLETAPWYMFFLLPVHYLMGPVQGAMVNWIGHKYGYRNYDIADKSHNAEPWGMFLLGELHQNNHHKYPTSLSFAKKWFEFDVAYPFIKLLSFLKVIKIA